MSVGSVNLKNNVYEGACSYSNHVCCILQVKFLNRKATKTL